MSAKAPARSPSAPEVEPLPGQLPIFLNIPPPLTPINDSSTTTEIKVNDTTKTIDGTPATSASSELDQRLFLTDCSNSCIAAWTMAAAVLVVIICAILLFVVHRRRRKTEKPPIDDFKPPICVYPEITTSREAGKHQRESDMSFGAGTDQRYLNCKPQESRASFENSVNYADDSPITPRFNSSASPSRLDAVSLADESRPPSFTPPQPPRSPIPVAQQPKFFEVKAEEHEGYYIADEEFQFHPQKYHNEQEDEVEEYYMPHQFDDESEDTKISYDINRIKL